MLLPHLFIYVLDHINTLFILSHFTRGVLYSARGYFGLAHYGPRT